MKKIEIAKSIDYCGKYTDSGFIGQKLLANFFNVIIRSTANLPINSVLEVGCAKGYSLDYLIPAYKSKHLEASDLESEQVVEAKRRLPQLTITQESIYKLNRENDSVDLILILEVLEHLQNPGKVLQEVSRVTKKYCLVSVPHEPLWRILNVVRGKYWSRWGNSEGHINHFSKRSLLTLISKHFTPIKILTPIPWIIVLAEKKDKALEN